MDFLMKFHADKMDLRVFQMNLYTTFGDNTLHFSIAKYISLYILADYFAFYIWCIITDHKGVVSHSSF